MSLKTPELETEDVELEGVGTVTVRELSGTELFLMHRKAARIEKISDPDEKDEAEVGLTVWVVRKAIDGVLDPARLPVGHLTVLQGAAMRLSRLDTGSHEEAVEDF